MGVQITPTTFPTCIMIVYLYPIRLRIHIHCKDLMRMRIFFVNIVTVDIIGVLMEKEPIAITLPTIIKSYLLNFGGSWRRILSAL